MKAIFSGKKTYIIAGLMVVVALINLISGDISLIQFVQDPNLILILQALGISFLRAGVSKG